MDDYDDDLADARVRAAWRRRKRAERSCMDGMCGADDCETCHPLSVSGPVSTSESDDGS